MARAPRKPKILQAVVDRVESALVVLSVRDKGQIQVPLSFFEETVTEGAVYEMAWRKNPAATASRRSQTQKLQRALLRRSQQNSRE